MSDTFPHEQEVDLRPRLGLIVLQADETIEDEFRSILDPKQVRLHVSRVPSGATLTTSTIHAMADYLPAAAQLFPHDAHFDAVAYACTSGSSLIGPERVATLVRQGCDTAAVTNPLTAAFAHLHALGAKQVGIVSPYVSNVAEAVRTDFEMAGFAVPATVSFGVQNEAHVARIDQNSIERAVDHLLESHPVDAVFLSCTNLRTLHFASALQDELGLPVLSSNGSLAWHLLRLAQLIPSE